MFLSIFKHILETEVTYFWKLYYFWLKIILVHSVYMQEIFLNNLLLAVLWKIYYKPAEVTQTNIGSLIVNF